MIVGVTGSRFNRRKDLMRRFRIYLSTNPVEEVHHGDCTGWDEQCQVIAEFVGVKTVAHPPDNDDFRAFTKSAIILPSKPFLDRNKDIVNAVDFLIAAPDGPEKQRSGTWSTVRYAKKVGVKGVVWM